MTETITISEQVRDHRAASAGRLPVAVAAVFAEEQAGLGRAGVPGDAVAPGARLPGFELPDQNGRKRALAELTADGPAVLVFYRGGWCPYCNIALRTYERDLLPALAERGASLVAISPETPDASLSTAEKAALSYPVLSDEGARLAETLGLVWQPAAATLEAQRALGLDIRASRADRDTRLPMPAVIVVDTASFARFVDVRADYTERTEVADILAAVDAVVKA